MTDGFSDPPRKFEGRKRTVEVSIDAALLAQAEAANYDLSLTLERALRRELADEERARQFYEENREEIDSYNRYIAEHGIWSEKYRAW